MRLLVIEDHRDTTNILRQILPLALEGAIQKTYYAATLAEAGNLMRRFEIDAVLFDVNLPDGNGFDFAEAWKTTHRTFICMSAYDKKQYFDHVLQCGVVAHLEKPFTVEILESALQKAYLHFQQREEFMRMLENTSNTHIEQERALYQTLKVLELHRTREDTAEQERQTTELLKNTYIKRLASDYQVKLHQSQYTLSPYSEITTTVPILLLEPALLNEDKLFIHDTDSVGSVTIAMRDIMLVEADKNYILLHCASRQEPLRDRATLFDYEERLQTKGFVRVHRKFLVPLHYVVKIHGEVLFLRNGTTVPIAKDRLHTVRASFQYYQRQQYPLTPNHISLP